MAVRAADVIVIGGGIVGAACAHALAADTRVILLEAEDAFGYHATGRSAALFSEYFGDAATRALTRASRAFLEAPPAEVAERSLLSPRGVVALATQDDVDSGRFETALLDGQRASIAAERIDLAAAVRLCPVLAPQAYAAALHRRAAQDIDVDALHQGLLRALRSRGGVMQADTRVLALARRGGVWSVRSRGAAGDCEWTAPLLVNAAGAWADEVAQLAGVRPLGLVPRRRTAVLVDLPDGFAGAAAWPMVTDLADTFYFKPESGRLMVCPSDATPAPPCDAQPEELDVAIAVARLEEVTTLRITRVTHKWAGLRTFAPDELPVLGPAADEPGFVWAAGLGGAGVQTAPAMARAVASLITHGRLPADLLALGLDAAMMSPSRPSLIPVLEETR